MKKIIIAGDSTAATKTLLEKPMSGWGDYLFKRCLDYQIVNLAVNGKSTKSFISEGDFSRLLRLIEPKDLVLLQFGHNDQKGENLARFTSAKEDYHANLLWMISQVKERKGKPIVLTPIARWSFGGEKLEDTHQLYSQEVRKVARESQIPLIDMTMISNNQLAELGPQKAKKLYLFLPKGTENYPLGLTDKTHFSEVGAHYFARVIEQHISHLIKSTGLMD